MLNDKLSKVFEVIKSTRTKLVNNWKERNAFLDKNAIRDSGLISEAMGCVSLLLPIVSLGDEPKVYDKASLEEVNQILIESIKTINDFIENEGYTASPFADSEITSALFGKEKGYVDSVTWVVSVCALSRYAAMKKLLSFPKEVNNIILKLYAESLKLLLNAQRDDGTWGFMTDKGSKRSLYFTYSAGCCLGDVFDYTFAEIKSVEDSNEGTSLNINIDKEAVDYIEANSIPDLKNVLDEARKKLAYWLISNAVPYLPQIAACKDLSPEIAEKLGIWNSSTKDFAGANYYYLYYTYYIIDLTVLMYADEDYANIVKENDLLFTNLKTQLSQSLSSDDYNYYFGIDGTPEKFVLDFIEQSTHASRFNLSSAMRTGNAFWDSTKSELQIIWEHTDPSIENLTKSVTSNMRNPITEPVLVPMALRANTQYTYYISEQADVTLDKLFENILADRSPKDSRNCLEGMWDNLYYSLPVTERAIEAIIDYYDYICKYDNNTQIANLQEVSINPVQIKSEIDEAIERKIEAVIQDKLKDYAAKPAENAEIKIPQTEIDPADLIKPVSIALSILTQELSSRLNTTISKGDEVDNAVYALSNLFSVLERNSKLAKIREYCLSNDKSLSQKELSSKVLAVESVLDDNKKELNEKIVSDILREGDKGLDLLALYVKILTC